MTALPTQTTGKKLGLVIDLDICVGCHACAVSCKEWNTGGYPAPLTDLNAYGPDMTGVWLNRIHHFEVALNEAGNPATPSADHAKAVPIGESQAVGSGRTVHFPRSCLHCETPDCVTVCPTGASYKRSSDGIVLVDEDLCIGCKLCSWACPYGAREYDQTEGVMKKCTLCVDRIYNDYIPEEDRIPSCVRTCPVGARHFGDLGDPESAVSKLVQDRGGIELMPELGYKPVNRYLPPRERKAAPGATGAAHRLEEATDGATGFLGWLDRALEKLG